MSPVDVRIAAVVVYIKVMSFAISRILLCLGMLSGSLSAQNAPLVLRFDKPAKTWESEAIPLGNGKIGAMVFGDPAREQIQFNENSLWSGDLNPSGDYNSMGSYQNFGYVHIEQEGQQLQQLSCASQHQAFFRHEQIETTLDDNTASKWCVEHHRRPVVWQLKLSSPKTVSSYSISSAFDVPARDALGWQLQASNDGIVWDKFGEVKANFNQRGQQQLCKINNDKAYSYYRVVFNPNPAQVHLQVGKIKLHGIDEGLPDRHQHYRRELDLMKGLHTISWSNKGVEYKREYFVSKQYNALIMRFSCNKPQALAGVISLKCAHQNPAVAAGKQLSFSGSLDNKLAYVAALRVIGGDVKVQADKQQLRFGEGRELVMALSCATSFSMQQLSEPAQEPELAKESMPSGEEQDARVAQVLQGLEQALEQCEKQPYATVLEQHLKQFSGLMQRVQLRLHENTPASENLSSSQLLERAVQKGEVTQISALLYQYGRYLLISSCQPDGLPANLQGLWNNMNNPPWHSDYHSNINTQMNYWGADAADLGEYHRSLLGHLRAIQPHLEQASREQFGHAGFTMRTSYNIFGGQGWEWNLPAAAWFARHFWQHYQYNNDSKYLNEQGWPFMYGACEFWLAALKKNPEGKWVVPNGWSPEHGPREDGVAHDQQIVWDLFNNTLKAGKLLKKDPRWLARLQAVQNDLQGPKIGSWGQIMEWQVEREELEKSQHRHTSHLYALYPGEQISLQNTPELAKAAEVSLLARGDSGDSRRSWTWAWRGCLWARLGRGDKCEQMLQGMVKHNLLDNFLATHPPFQIDGNFGVIAAINEMLLQDHTGVMHLLPALAPSWQQGRVEGLVARGNIRVDLAWEQGKLESFVLLAAADSKLQLQAPAQCAALESGEGKALRRLAAKQGRFSIDLQKNKPRRFKVVY